MRKAARCLLPLLLAFCVLLPLSACADAKGTRTDFDGYVVRTEKTHAAADGDVRSGGMLRSADGDRQEDYVLNVSSHKFHYPWCGAVGEIKEKNRWEYRGTRQSVLDMGYEPCKSCDP